MDQRPASDQAQAHANRRAQEEDGHRPPQLRRREQVAEHGEGGRGDAGLPHSDADAGEEKLGVATGQSRPHREQAEQAEADAGHQLAGKAVEQPADGNGAEHIEQAEGHALQHAEVGVVEMELGLDRFDRQVDDGAVALRGDGRQAQQGGDQPPTRGARPSRLGLLIGRVHDAPSRFPTRASPT